MRTKYFMAIPITLILLVVALVGGCNPINSAGAKDTLVGLGDIPDGELYQAAWSRHDSLTTDHKYQEALDEARLILATARYQKNEDQWTRALIACSSRMSNLGEVEASITFFRAEPWPTGDIWRVPLEMQYAGLLATYQAINSREIRQREFIASSEAKEIKHWTSERIDKEIRAAYLRLWEDRDSWGTKPVGVLGRYFSEGSYPARIRGTLRDVYSYAFAGGETFQGHQGVLSGETLYRLDIPSLVEGSRGGHEPVNPAGENLLGAQVRAAILDDLEQWHLKNNEPEAALEARLERLSGLRNVLPSDDQILLRKNLEQVLESFDNSYPWWSAGQALLATMHQRESDPESQILAHRAAKKGFERHPETHGGTNCQAIMEEIESRHLQLETMQVDNPNKRSIAIQHRNIGKVYFRAWRLDLEHHVSVKKNVNMVQSCKPFEKWIANQKPDLEWSEEIPNGGDYRSHTTYVTLPLDQKGLYMIAGSLRRDFGESSNLIRMVNVLVSDLVLISSEAGLNREITARSGTDGRALAGVELQIYGWGPKGKNKLLKTLKTNQDGLVSFPAKDYSNNHNFIFAKQGDNLAVFQETLFFNTQRPANTMPGGAIFTDRSIYRPGQTVHWKVVGYEYGSDFRKFKTLPDRKITVSLRDANYKTVATDTLWANEMGTASGEFRIPSGRTLGNWTVQSSIRATASIRVEEYKRPTFEVVFPDQEEALRLNRPVQLTGSARYYFGLPVTDGDVKWRVERSAPRWFYGYGRPGYSRKVIASGEGQLDASGDFLVAFTPEADERLAKDKGVSYSYTLNASVTDAGGEVHEAQMVFQVGFVSVDAKISADWQLLLEGKTDHLTVSRTNLSGQPRAGKGSWTLMALEQPSGVVLPCDVPLETNPRDVDPYQTPGDSMRGRWDSTLRNKLILAGWANGVRLDGGDLDHGADGKAKVQLPDLRAGAYRLVYETTDEENNLCQRTHDFLVAGQKRTPLALALVLQPEKTTVRVGETARFLVKSALPNQELVLEIYQDRRRIQRLVFQAGKDRELFEIPVTEKLRGGFSLRLSALRDHQMMQISQSVFVPYDSRELEVEFLSFRDHLKPGQKESFSVHIQRADGKPVEKETTELLAYMYDRSLDIFSPHNPPNPRNLFRPRVGLPRITENLGHARSLYHGGHGIGTRTSRSSLLEQEYVYSGLVRLQSFFIEKSAYMSEVRSASAGNVVPAPMDAEASVSFDMTDSVMGIEEAVAEEPDVSSEPTPPDGLRQNFAETAFFAPHIKVDDEGSATIEFEVPDSVTDWNIWVHAITTDLSSGSASKTASSVKELMVRTYLPRFLREGDQADLKVVVNNAGDSSLDGTVNLQILDAVTGRDRAHEFGLTTKDLAGLPFTVVAGGGFDFTFSMQAPTDLTSVIVRVDAKANGFADGEQRPLPILPSRLHLAQSRFVALTDASVKTLHFADMAKNDDPTLTHDQLVVTVDAQLFYGVLGVLPYLVEYPYECTEQLLNRYLSTGIVTSVFDKYPAVASMAKKLSLRDTRYETFDAPDPNLKMRLEETPWLNEAEGGRPLGKNQQLINVLDPRTASLVKDQSLAKLKEYQAADGGFPWRMGGRTSPYMTLYVLSSFARGLEFGVEAPRDMTRNAWGYVHRYFENELVDKMLEEDCCLERVTFLNYVLSCYPDPSYYEGTFTSDQRQLMLEKSFRDWRKLSPRLIGYLALTLDRSGRGDDARLIFDSVMDGAIEDEQLGTHWAREDRAWLWYNDTVESHASILRVLTELNPQDERRHGIVHWLLMNKKLNHWQSTRSTAEVVYALVHYLDKEQMLGIREEVVVEVGAEKREYIFEPDEYTGKKNQWVIPGVSIDPATSSTVTISKETKGTAFASATWHFSTDTLPAEARGDLLQVERRSFKRSLVGNEWVLSPLDEGAEVVVGDQVEVQLTVRAKHASEYVHLRDPRGAGFEPEAVRSGYRWDLGIAYYSETRDSGANFFFDRLPAGEYVLKYRLRANMSGTFRVGPAVLQSVYAPEFVGYSVGSGVVVKEAE